MSEEKKYLNLTQHATTKEQQEAGIVEPSPEVKAKIRELITFNERPTESELFERAEQVAALIPEEYNGAMIGGASYFQGYLESAIARRNMEPVYAFSQRRVVLNPDGTKTTQFNRFEGLVEGNEKPVNYVNDEMFSSKEYETAYFRTRAMLHEQHINEAGSAERYYMNLTLFTPTAEQSRDGVIEPDAETKNRINQLSTFTEIPTRETLERNAKEIVSMIDPRFDGAMIGGAPYFTPYLEKELAKNGFEAVHSYSERKVIENTLEDGTVEKKSVFTYQGLVHGNEEPSFEALYRKTERAHEQGDEGIGV